MSQNNFKKGFKSWCENVAMSYRKSLNVNFFDPLSPRDLAVHLNIHVLKIDDLSLPKDVHEHLTSDEGSQEWSALSVSANNQSAIIINERHTEGRKNNSLMHELSHFILEHKPSQLFSSPEAGMLRNYDALQEEEADWLAGALLLPRSILFNAQKHGYSNQYIAEKFSVSEKLVAFRKNVTGLNRRTS